MEYPKMYCKLIKPNQVITAKDLMKDPELHNHICILLSNAQTQSEKSTSRKRFFLMEQDEKLKSIFMDDRMIYDMVYSYKKAFLSMFQDEGLSPVFSERDFFDTEVCVKINQIADFDVELMSKDQKDQKMLSDVFDYGVGIRLYEGRDNNRKTASYFCPSPLARYPDPSGNVFENSYDYHLFARQTSIEELEYKEATIGGYMCLDEVIPGDQGRVNFDQKNRIQRGIGQPDTSDGTVYVWLCYITINGIRYCTTIANNFTKIIKRDIIEPMTLEEKQNKDIVPFPISLSYTTPNAFDPFGESYREKIKPVQVALTQLVNAIHSKQLRDAGHDIVFYDIDRVDNPADLLQRPDGGPVFIPTTQLSAGPITSTVLERNDTNKSSEYIMQLQSRVENSTALTGVIRGQESAQGTLGETQIQIQRSSAMFSVDAKNLIIGERMFWTNIYYRSLKQNIVKAKEKIVILSDQSTLIRLGKTELLGASDPYIKIISKKEKIMSDKSKSASMLAIFPLLQQDPNVHPISVAIFKREMMMRQGLDWNFITSVEPMSPSERHSKSMQDIINAGETPKNLIIPGIDLQTLWIYMNMCIDNEVKEKILAYLNVKMVQEGIAQPKASDMGGAIQGTANSMASQAMGNQIATQNKSEQQQIV